jgi:type VI secretion system protein ImpA
MSYPDDLLKLIEGANPSGISLRYDPLYDKIKEARREEDQPPPGMTERDRKVADNPLVIKLGTDALLYKTKDLQIAAWLTEAWLKQSGFSGLLDGLGLSLGLADKFWETVYPELDEGDVQPRGAPLGFIGTKLEIPMKLVPLVQNAAYGFIDYKNSRDLGYEEGVKTDDAKKKRAQLIQEGRVSPELFDKAFEDTPKKFYLENENYLDACLLTLKDLKAFCDQKFQEEGPSFGPLESTLQDCRHLVHTLLQKKREKEPDPVEEVALEANADAAAAGDGEALTAPAMRDVLSFSLETSSESPQRLEAILQVAEAAAFLRQHEPRSPAPYLMLRGLRWGELRAAVENGDHAQLEAPPTELRKHLKQLALKKKWAELLAAAESAMALPCSRAWLDLQRFVLEACQGLGSNYDGIAKAIRSALKALIADMPQLLDAMLSDDTPAANAETRAMLTNDGHGSPSAFPIPTTANGSEGTASQWPAQQTDIYTVAIQALRSGQERMAFDILQQEVARQRSGRERFRRKMQLVELCASAGKLPVAQPILDDLAAAIENHKLDDWEEARFVAGSLSTIMKLSARIQADKAQQQKLFERICRLDPGQTIEEGK